MSVKEIKNVNIIYKTSDGNYFSNRDDAQIHENRLLYEKMMDEGENIFSIEDKIKITRCIISNEEEKFAILSNTEFGKDMIDNISYPFPVYVYKADIAFNSDFLLSHDEMKNMKDMLNMKI